MHSKVEYIVAHGIASRIGNDRVIIGSSHFVFEDEKCVIPEGEEEKFHSLPPEYSHLYLAVAGRLAAVICIEDPLREEARGVIQKLKTLGISKVVMMTGDSERTARSIAARVGVDEYYSEVLPEDKAGYVETAKEEGHKVIMVGDGINDTQALALANVSMAIGKGTDVAMDVAQITLMSDDLLALPEAVKLSQKTVHMIWQNLFWAFIYNIICIPLAAGALHIFGIDFQITPMWASALMAFSSVSVVLNSLRLRLA